jgi:hypothetical protein
MNTNELTGRELAVACARAMGWTKPSERGCCDDCGWPLRRSEEIGCTPDRCCMVGRDDGRADEAPQRTVEHMLAWLHERGNVEIHTNKDNAQAWHHGPQTHCRYGATLTEALQRLVVAVAQRGSNNKEER